VERVVQRVGEDVGEAVGQGVRALGAVQVQHALLTGGGGSGFHGEPI
jgi:hypothetical protein